MFQNRHVCTVCVFFLFVIIYGRLSYVDPICMYVCVVSLLFLSGKFARVLKCVLYRALCVVSRERMCLIVLLYITI